MKGTTKGREWRWFARELRPFAGLQAASTTCLIGSTLLSLVDPLIVKWLIDHGLAERRWPAILIAVGAFCAAYAGRMLLVVAASVTSARILDRLMLRLRLRLLRRVQRMDAAFFDRHPVGELVQRMEQDVEQVGAVGTTLAPTLVRIAVSAAATLGIMFALNWRLTLMVMPLVPIFLVLRAHFRSRLEQASDTTRAASGERTSFLNDVVSSVVQVQLLRAEPFFRARYGALTVGAVRAGVARRRVEIGYSASSFAVLTVATGSVLLAGAWQVMAGALTLGGYIAFYSYLTRLFDPLGAAVETHSALKRAGASIRRISELETREPAVRDLPAARPLPPACLPVLGCRDVAFAYTEGHPVLRDVSMRLERGERLALVGRSGSGKSTLARLLVRLYDAPHGEVFAGEDDVRSLRLRGLREAVSLVPARPVLFRGTLRENVLLGRRAVSDAELDRLARVACFDTVADKFPARWDHPVGAGGAGLSDGEQQRLGLLRALVRDSQVLILDEATGALDPLAEAEVLSRLHEHARGKSILLITHRLSAACWAERILLLDGGVLHPSNRPEDFAAYAAAVGVELYSLDPLEAELRAAPRGAPRETVVRLT